MSQNNHSWISTPDFHGKEPAYNQNEQIKSCDYGIFNTTQFQQAVCCRLLAHNEVQWFFLKVYTKVEHMISRLERLKNLQKCSGGDNSPWYVEYDNAL